MHRSAVMRGSYFLLFPVLSLIGGCTDGGARGSSAPDPSASAEASSPARPSTAPASLCAPDALTIRGPDGTTSTGRALVGTSSSSLTSTWFTARGTDGTRLHLVGKGTLSAGESIAGPALLEGPAGRYCGDPSSAVTHDESAYRFTLRSAGALTACDEAPAIAGTLRLCTGVGQCGLTGNVDGNDATFAVAGGGSSTVGPTFSFTVGLETPAIVTVDVDGATSTVKSATIYVQGWANNAVICARGGKAVRDVDHGYEIELGDLHRMGACAGVSDVAIEGCVL